MKNESITGIKGVNLGNWLVLEKWMSPDLFAGTDAKDEYYLPEKLPRESYEARIRQHRAEYITERDFVIIKSMGLNTVRIPVPYFIFGDRPPFIGCIDCLDKAFSWAERYGLKILIDLHTAPSSQNGFDNGGICGVCRFFSKPEEIEFVYTVLERLAERYRKRDGLWGIEILNEPISKEMWVKIGVQKKYPPVDAEMAEGSDGYDPDELKAFYLTAYDRIMKYLPPDKIVAIHDGFDLMAWKDFMQEEKFGNVVLDTHLYLMGDEILECEKTIEGYERYINERFARPIAKMQQYFPVICGEWCLSSPLSIGASDEERSHIYRALDKAQKSAWAGGSGYCYWSYKLLSDTTNISEQSGRDAWDLGRCFSSGWFSKEE